MAASNISAVSDTSFEEHRGRYCAICYHRFSRDGSAVPRILSCGHSFCTECLGRLIGNVLRGYIRCPTCKRDTMVPGLTNEVTKLAKNFGVLDLLEGIDEENAAAVAAVVSVTNTTPLCSAHENEPMKVFCLTDNEIICIYCQVYGTHNGHECKLVSELAQQYRQVLHNLCEVLVSKKEAIASAKTVVNDTGSAVCLKEDKLMREITHHFEMQRRKLLRREAQLKALLKNRTSAKVMLLDKQKRQITDLITKCDEQNEICQNAMSGSDHELLLQKEKLQKDTQALTTQVQKHDMSPCTRDDLVYQLDRITNHGVLLKDSRRGAIAVSAVASAAVTYPSAATAGVLSPSAILSTSSVPGADHEGESSSTPPSGGDMSPVGSDTTTGVDSEEQDIEWQELEAAWSNPGVNMRRRLEAPDVLIFDDDDMNLAVTGDIAESSNTPMVMSNAIGGSGDMKCGGCGSPKQHNRSSSRTSKRTLHPSPGRQSRRTNYTETTSSTSEESPDLSDLSDMELERSIRSAWGNQSGWSAADAAGGDVRDTTKVHGAVGGASLRTSTNAVSARQVMEAMRNRELDNEEDLNQRQMSDIQGNRVDNQDPWEIATCTTPTHRNRSTNHVHARTKVELKCSVFNCSSGSTSFFVKCKNCSRLFCQHCTSSSISARRCYKRPRGHSFVFIPCNGGNASANNNQVRHQHGHKMSTTLQTSGKQNHHFVATLQSSEPSWRCSNCSTYNKHYHRSRSCIRCGRQSRGARAEKTASSERGVQQRNHTTTTENLVVVSQELSTVAEDARAVEQDSELLEGNQDEHPVGESDEPSGPSQQVHPDDQNQPISSGISSSNGSSNDSCYENVCPSCSAVNSDEAMDCTGCSTQLFL